MNEDEQEVDLKSAQSLFKGRDRGRSSKTRFLEVCGRASARLRLNVGAASTAASVDLGGLELKMRDVFLSYSCSG